jgi:hypothetical protein
VSHYWFDILLNRFSHSFDSLLHRIIEERDAEVARKEAAEKRSSRKKKRETDPVKRGSFLYSLRFSSFLSFSVSFIFNRFITNCVISKHNFTEKAR